MPFFWKPDLEIYQLKEFFRPTAVRDIGGLSIDVNKVITYTLSVYITVECPFNFDNFPMDKQVTATTTLIGRQFEAKIQ